DSIATLNRLAGGRTNVEAGLQTGLDVIATVAWWDWSAGAIFSEEMSPDEIEEGRGIVSPFGVLGSATWIVATATLVGWKRPENQPKD
ncbi:MAG TPA: hypothetical protein QF646_01425, partial [Candidatus Poseidoniales archaeon]|nr:hypothetical protein [Candidatus Poseidoniales archaeon]